MERSCHKALAGRLRAGAREPDEPGPPEGHKADPGGASPRQGAQLDLPGVLAPLLEGDSGASSMLE
jgi:hypothetical protein